MGHDHDHKSDHAHGPSKYGAAFAIGISLNLAFVIVETVYGILSHSIDPEQVHAYLASLTGVLEVHDLHIWAMSTTETARLPTENAAF